LQHLVDPNSELRQSAAIEQPPTSPIISTAPFNARLPRRSTPSLSARQGEQFRADFVPDPFYDPFVKKGGLPKL
jgi:hypothetical protein